LQAQAKILYWVVVIGSIVFSCTLTIDPKVLHNILLWRDIVAKTFSYLLNVLILVYFNNVQATEFTIKQRWLHTGDIGYFDGG
jgi:hypothetical protein